MPRRRRGPGSLPADCGIAAQPTDLPPPNDLPLPRSFAARIAAWQRVHGRHDLPWQGTGDAYRIWLSEVMLQQTQVATVVPYYERFVSEFPDVAALAAAPLARVLELWSGLGYYRRTHQLHAAARVVVADHGGVFPSDAAVLGALPGIGRSTAAAIATFSGGAPAPILDGNVKRVLARHRGIAGYPGTPAVEKALWDAAEALFADLDDDAIAYTQGLMDLGAGVCARRDPDCAACPVAADCVARVSARIAELPAPRPSRKLPHRTVRMLVVERAGELLLERRPPTGIWAGLWSLPEIDPEDDVVLFFARRFGATVVPGPELEKIEHGFTHFRLTIVPQRVSVQDWPAGVATADTAWLWLPRAEAVDAALPAPVRRLLRTL